MNEQGLAGTSIEDVVAALVDRDDDRDRDTVRAALDPVTEDGVVTREAVDEAVSDTSKLLATTETRVELAGIAYDDVTEVAAGVEDVPVVAARLDEFGERLADARTRADGLSEDLSGLDAAPETPDGLYELATGLREVAGEAQAVARAADDLNFDCEEFEAWLEGPSRRYDQFEEDAEYVEETLGELSTAVDAIPSESDAPAADWADATMRARVLALLVEDLRAELEDLRTLADRQDAAFDDSLGDLVAALDRDVADLTDVLDDRAEPAWRDRFGDDVTAFEEDLAAIEPPVDWQHVQETFERRRDRTFDDR